MGSKGSSSNLTSLPTELLHIVLSFLNPYELIAFAQTSKYAMSVAAPSNQILWRYAFLQLFDDPAQAWSEMLPSAREANASIEAGWDWYLRLRERCIALKTVTTKDRDYRRLNLRQSTDVLVEVIETARHKAFDARLGLGSHEDYETRKSKSIRTLEDAFKASWEAEKVIHDFLPDAEPHSGPSNEGARRSRRFMVMGRSAEPVSENASRLHVYYGTTQREKENPRSQIMARRIVYDLEHASEANDYGPFKPDGSGHIDWTVLEAVSSLIRYAFEVRMVKQFNIKIPPSFGCALPNQIGIEPTCPDDWAGVTRRWLGTYLFLEHTINTGFQFSRRNRLEDRHEAHGDLLFLDLKLDNTITKDWRLKTSLPVCDDLPILYFSGPSRGSDSTQAFTSVRGTVSLLPGGRCVRWRFIVR